MKKCEATSDPFRRFPRTLLIGLLLILSGSLSLQSKAREPKNQVFGKPFHVSSRSFGSTVLEAETPVLVDFWAPWCGPCRTMAPWLEELSAELGEQMRIVKLNVDENPSLARRYRIMGLPTLVLFDEGQEVDRLIGLLSKGRIKSRLQARLDSRQ